MTLLEQKQYYEWLKSRLWRPIFKGSANKGTYRQLEFCLDQLKKINEIEFPRKKRSR